MQQDPNINHGLVISNVGQLDMSNFAVGPHATVNAHPSSGQLPAGKSLETVTIGVITILSEETAPVIEMLKRGAGFTERYLPGTGRRLHEATIAPGSQQVHVVHIQTTDRGQRSAAASFAELQTTCSPVVTVVTGIAGAIHPSLSLGDVVVAEEVCYYDSRRVSASGDLTRGQTLAVPSATRNAINAFFADQGEPVALSMPDPYGHKRTFYVRRGMIGSGEAVVADAQSSIVTFLRSFNEKILALDTETGGIAQAAYESTSPVSWLAIRGISDRADSEKDDSYHGVASVNAAAVLEKMLGYLGRAAATER